MPSKGSPASNIPRIAVGRFVFAVRAGEAVGLPFNPGDRFHSRFGATLRRLVCLTGERECDGCLLAGPCPYTFLLMTSGKVRHHPRSGGDRAPHPFVFDLAPGPIHLEKGQGLDLNLTLVGRAAEYLPYVVMTVMHMGDEENERGKRPYWPFALESVRQSDGRGRTRTVFVYGAKQIQGVTPPEPLTFRKPRASLDVELEFDNPMALKVRGKIAARAPSMKTLMMAIVRRVGALCAAHTDLPLLVGYEPLFDLSDEVDTVASNVRMVRWERKSKRQGRKVPMKGLVGSVTYERVPGKLLPWLKLGEVLHVGKGTGFGLGKYLIAE